MTHPQSFISFLALSDLKNYFHSEEITQYAQLDVINLELINCLTYN